MNVLLVAVDTLSARHMGCYGYHRDTSPFMDGLAAENVLFESLLDYRSYCGQPFSKKIFGDPGFQPAGEQVISRFVEVPVERIGVQEPAIGTNKDIKLLHSTGRLPGSLIKLVLELIIGINHNHLEELFFIFKIIIEGGFGNTYFVDQVR